MRTITLSLMLLAGCQTTTEPADDTDVAGEDGCQDGVCILSGTIVDDLTLTADKQWLLRGGVFIGDDETPTVLTIEPGTTVYGESATDGMLVIRRNSRILAEGRADAPIVFTSSKAPGSRSAGDWGGIILNGKAPVNSCGDEAVEACEAFGEGGTGWYGGDDPADDSGVLTYVRVEFAGNLVSPDNELNGVAFQGVGSGTVVDYLQVHWNADDGVEFFGGTVGVKHVLVTGPGDDGIDWTDGWVGKLQYGVVQQYAGTGDNAIEADNNADDNDALPRSKPTLANVTLIGSPDSEKSDLGLLLREGTAGTFTHLYALGFNEACVDVDHDATFAHGELEMTHSRVDCATSFVEDADEPTTMAAWFAAGVDNAEVAITLGAPFNEASPNFQPAAAETATFEIDDAFFDEASYIGAFDGTNDWTAGWTTAAAN